jgi:hypothetical protein
LNLFGATGRTPKDQEISTRDYDHRRHYHGQHEHDAEYSFAPLVHGCAAFPWPLCACSIADCAITFDPGRLDQLAHQRASAIVAEAPKDIHKIITELTTIAITEDWTPNN